MQGIFTCLRFAITLMLSGVLLEICAQSQDAQLWSSFELEKKLDKHNSLHAKYQFRLAENFSRADYTFLDLGYDYSPNKNIDFSAAYCFNIKNNIERGWTPRHQWYANFTYSKKFGDLKIANRNQIQNDIEDAGRSEGTWFYRNKTQLRYSLNNNLTPFISAEGYLRLGIRPAQENFFYRTRYMLGLNVKLSKHQKLEFSYLLQRQIRKKKPDFIHAYCVTYSLTIK
ncbi:MAG: DUF2490 domain-containing protein [Flavobacteriales bacterium]